MNQKNITQGWLWWAVSEPKRYGAARLPQSPPIERNNKKGKQNIFAATINHTEIVPMKKSLLKTL